MIDQLQHELATLYSAARETVSESTPELCGLIGVVDKLRERIVDLEHKVKSQSAVINELVGRANE